MSTFLSSADGIDIQLTKPRALVDKLGTSPAPPETIQRAYDEADLNRAVSAYRFFYRSVSIIATWKGNMAAGTVANQVFPLLEGTPQQFVFTPNSDTPYAGLVIDLSTGPMVIELPPGPLMGTG